MKVLVYTYDTAFQNKAGGVHTRIVKTVKALQTEGIEVEYFDKIFTNVTEYDILHVFKLDVSNLNLIKYAKDKGLKIVLSSIVTLEKGSIIDAYWKFKKLPIMTTYKLLFQEIDLVDSIVVETRKEKEFIVKHYHANPNKIVIIPNGVDEVRTESKSIYEVLGKKCDYALEVARFDENKNQLNVIRAMRDSKINVVFVGGKDFTAPNYYNICLEAARGATNIYFLGWLDSTSDLLASAYSNAKVLVSSSFCETFGLSIIEGIIAGATPVVSESLPILDYEIFRSCITFNPHNPKEIRSRIEQAMENAPVNSFQINVKKFFLWSSVAKKHVELYSGLIK